MTTGEITTRDIFKNNFSLELEKISESLDKSSDFYLLRCKDRIAVCEIKDIKYVEPSEEAGFKREGPAYFWHRPDNTPSRIGNKIYEAYQQLVNYNLPKILVLVAFKGDILDLNNAINGFLDFRDEKGNLDRMWNAKKVAYGRIRDIKEKIDLYVWIQYDYSNKHKIFFRYFPNNMIAKNLMKMFRN